MDEKSLKDYIPLKEEVKHLEQLRASIQKEVEDEVKRGYIRKASESSFTAILDYYDKLIAKHRAELQAVEEDINALPDWARELLELRYIKGKSWDAMTFETYYSLTSLHRLHRKALALL